MNAIRERILWIAIGLRHRWLMWYSPSYRFLQAGRLFMPGFREGFESYDRVRRNRLWIDRGDTPRKEADHG